VRSDLPPGPSYPPYVQGIAFWNRPLAFLEKCRSQYGKRFTIRLPFTPYFVMLTEPDQVKQMFTAPPDVLHPGEGARVLEPIVGSYSVLLLDGDAHMSQKKLMLPAFHGEKMAQLSGLMDEVTQREVAELPRDEPVELHPVTQRLTLEIILRAAFGLDPGPRLDALRDRLGAMLEFGDRPSSLMVPPKDSLLEKVMQKVGPAATFLKLQAEADELIFEQIHERRRSGDEDRDDILSMLLEARHEDGSPMTDQELRDELMTILVAGHETTASTLAWAFSQLPHHPAVLDRLTDEVRNGDDGEYLDATINETLRHRPVLPNVQPRLVKKPIQIGDWEAPPGVCLVANAYLMHHDADIYDDPYVFRPERFVEEGPGTYTFIPFGGGRRRCLGASFAMVEMRLVLRAVLSQCDLRAGSGGGAELAQRRNITVRPAGGARAVLHERKPAPVAA
jgi:cytochrome P450